MIFTGITLLYFSIGNYILYSYTMARVKQQWMYEKKKPFFLGFFYLFFILFIAVNWIMIRVGDMCVCK